MTARPLQEIIADRPLVTATAQTTVRAACRLMAERRIGALLIVDGERTAGIFTERDALNKVLAGALDPDTTPLSAVMVRDPQCVRADRPLAHALLLMAEGGFRHVPVIDADGRAIGMVSARDALGRDLVQLEHDIERLEALESSIGY